MVYPIGRKSSWIPIDVSWAPSMQAKTSHPPADPRRDKGAWQLVVGSVKAWEAGERAIPEFTKSSEERVVA
jgi:hypothetical protein